MNKNTLRKIAADIAGKVEHDFVEPIKPKTVVIIILPPKRNISIFATSPHPEVSLTILAIALGFFGIHRFYVGKIGSSFIWLLTCGGFFFGYIYDIIKVLSGTFKDGNGLPVKK